MTLSSEVLSHLNEIDFELYQSDSDVLGDAYEYLIGKFAAGARKEGGRVLHTRFPQCLPAAAMRPACPDPPRTSARFCARPTSFGLRAYRSGPGEDCLNSAETPEYRS